MDAWVDCKILRQVLVVRGHHLVWLLKPLFGLVQAYVHCAAKVSFEPKQPIAAPCMKVGFAAIVHNHTKLCGVMVPLKLSSAIMLFHGECRERVA
ncbi:hypothetical protein [Roseibium album]|uniref:Uncharacterized protein n=1 Tax=Roseibium album TaxID=311410 RepID=A0A0M6ZV72_9HYPH|nr:hypothetical protein [Roseibium album]CTQ58247.1 hypothetical protein LA5094_01005 [Roseibium album]CTQ65960.1 hypothetical protein LA5096_00916 [Roseibium album]CTQ70887.1 hypothetical protein LA5095_02060 [Roseibium album]